MHLFGDARGFPPHLGAVLYCDGGVWWTHMPAPPAVLAHFRARKDNQIMGLELLAISLGLCTFGEWLKDRSVVIHSDNTGSEVTMRRGTARSLDHAQLVHSQWHHVARLGAGVYVKRVATDDNIADLPSREEFRICETKGAVFVPPALETKYGGDEWGILQHRWSLL